MPVHDHGEVQVASFHGDVGDVGAPDLIQPSSLRLPQQIRLDFVLQVRLAGS